MAKSNTPGAGKIILMILLVLVAMAAYGCAIALYGMTLVDWRVPVIAGAGGAAITGVVLGNKWNFLTRSHSYPLNFCVHFFFTAGICIALLLGLNFWGASDSGGHKEMAVIVRKYSETRHRSKRVGRRYVAQGEPYKAYYAEIAFADGRHKTMGVSVSRYRGMHQGDSIPVTIKKGVFGWPVIKYGPASPASTSPRGAKKRKRSHTFRGVAHELKCNLTYSSKLFQFNFYIRDNPRRMQYFPDKKLFYLIKLNIFVVSIR